MKIQPFKISGSQTVLDEPAGASASKAIFDAEQAASFYEVIVSGQNVRVSVYSGTSRATRVHGLQPPIRFSVVGNCTIEAAQDDNGQACMAWTAVRPATGTGQTEAAGSQTHTGDPAADTLQMSAIEVEALSAATVTVQGNPIALAPREKVSVRYPSTLDAGTVLVRYAL